MGAEQAQSRGLAKDHKGEFSAGSEQQSRFQRRRAAHPEGAGEAEDDGAFQNHQAERRGENGQGIARQSGEIDAEADEQEESPEQQPLEGFDDRLDGAAVFGFRQHQSGDESTKRHRQPGQVGHNPGAHRDQQSGGHEEVGAVGARHQPQQRAQCEAPDQYDNDDGKRGLGKGKENSL